jgi:phage tail sheath protein FI
MPQTLDYPGVYLQEVASGVRTVVGVATSITAFVGMADAGAPNTAIQIFSVTEYEKAFGKVSPNNPLSLAVQLFFLNGGGSAYVVNVMAGGTAATGIINDDQGRPSLKLTAAVKGAAGNQLRVFVDHDTADPKNLFNLSVFRETFDVRGNRTLTMLEGIHRNLSMNPLSSTYVEKYLNRVSRYVTATVDPATLANVNAIHSTSKSGSLGGPDLASVEDAAGQAGQGRSLLAVMVDGMPPFEIDFLTAGAAMVAVDGGDGHRSLVGGGDAAKFANLALAIQDRLLTSAGLVGLTCVSAAVGGGGGAPQWTLTISSGSVGAKTSVRVVPASNPDRDASTVLHFGGTHGGTETDASAGLRPAENSKDPAPKDTFKLYYIGFNGGAANDTRQGAVTSGADGTEPGTDAGGIEAWQNAFNVLRTVDLFNLLVLPAVSQMSIDDAKKLVPFAVKLCEDKRAFYIADLPDPDDATNINSVRDHFQLNFTSSISKFGAVFYPKVTGPSPAATGGALAGVFARTDAERGVWKAPAGISANLRGIDGLNDLLTDKKNGVLNVKGINVLRAFPAYGNVIWGARTGDGDDAKTSDWKYIPVRRTALFLEESLYRATQWVVFEPNDEPLWAQIRLSVGAFMQGLFRQGAFQGRSAQEAYFVRCDKETTTQTDINLGIVNIRVGFAPLKPAEFVVISLQQMAGQIGV